MKSASIIILLIVIAASAFVGYKAYHRIQARESLGRSAGGQTNRLGNKQEGAIPQSGDLCGGTGGNGEIVSLGKNVFTLKLNDGSKRIVDLANQATIKISAGSSSASESDLKVGDRVTLVGAPNSDGSFTANGVYVCSGN